MASLNLFKIFTDFLCCWKQSVVLNGEYSSWENVNAWVPQDSILGPFLLLSYINDLSHKVSSNCNFFDGDTSLVNGVQSSATTVRNDLTIISNWEFQWKMIFNPGLTKQPRIVIISRKTKKLLHPSISSNNIPLKNSISQKTSSAEISKAKLHWVNEKYHSKN